MVGLKHGWPKSNSIQYRKLVFKRLYHISKLTQINHFQIGFVLYPPIKAEKGQIPWDPNDHGQMMVITVIFTLHLAIIILFHAAVGWLTFMVRPICTILLLKSILTRPNEFGSMTARKDDTSPIRSIFCHARP